MDFDKFLQVGVGLLKDRTAWFGSITSGVTAWWTKLQLLSFALPTTAAEWAAMVLSIVSTIYVVFKIVRLWKNSKREE